ncbi:MAG: hypothetical protein ACXWU1_01590 [Allosphingosinicella sp.]
MRIILIGAGALLVAALAGCGDGGSGAANESADATANAADAGGSDNVANRLEAMPEGQRNAVFIRAIQDADGECQHVDSSSRGGEHEGFPVWVARCTDGVAWTIVIGRDGVASVLNPAEAELLKGNEAAPQNQQGE